MSLSDSLNLLRDYAERGNEAAFRELVSRYVDFVYSTAVRRAGGDAELAHDVTQTVFTDLARKAKLLRNVEHLGGWLHRHTGFVAATMLRSEHRRQAREQEAAKMNALENSSDALWQQLAPLLDETIDSLDAADRKAILLRFFERRDFQSIGAALGISDDAAQKRVSRALEKLRSSLANRGVTLSVALLATLMAGKAVSAAPVGIAAQVATIALAGAVSGAGVAVTLMKLAGSLGFKLAVGAAVVGTAALLLWPQLSNQRRGPARQGNTATASANTDSAQNGAASNFNAPMLTASRGVAAEANDASNKLALRIVTADTGQPIPTVTIDYTLMEGTNRLHKQYQATRFGICVVPVPRKTATRLLLWSQTDGFADTWLNWRKDRGDLIPEEYTLRLARAVKIGGKVVGADGEPVSGAEVGFGAVPGSALEEAHPQAHATAGFAAVTDAQGHWTLNRIAPEVLRRLDGGASHPEHVTSGRVHVASNPDAEKELLSETYVFRLGQAVRFSGIVTDLDGQPVSDARIGVSAKLVNSREGFSTAELRRTTNQLDGTFFVTGCTPGENRISVEAGGFVPTNLLILVNSNSAPVHITMQRGREIRLRVVNQRGVPLPGAEVEFRLPTGGVVRKTDAEGRLDWNGVPSPDVAIDIRATGFKWVENLPVEADGQQHDIVLERTLTLSGTIRDAETGQPIRHFRIVPGWPTRYFGVTNIQWQSTDRIPWIGSYDGAFRQAVKEATDTNTSLVFKFQAEDHAPFVTQTVNSDEGEVHFDIVLRPAAPTIVTVLDRDGKPAAGADVGLVYPGARLHLIPGGISHNDPSSGSKPLAADANGKFSLPPDDTIDRVIAANGEGFREATRDQLIMDPTIRLQPWGRIEGVFLSGGEVAAHRIVQFQYGLGGSEHVIPATAFNTLSSDPITFSTETDQEGHFVFPKVPPGKHGLAERRSVTINLWRSVPLTGVGVRPGETTTVTVGASNYIVTVKINWPENLQRNPDWRIAANLQTPSPAPPAELQNDPQSIAIWRAKPEIKEAIANRRRYQLSEGPENVFTAEDVAPGSYVLDAFVLESTPAIGEPAKIRARGQISLTLPANLIGSKLDAGEIDLQPVQ